MLHPSYTDLMKVANSEVKVGEKPLSIAIDEMNQGKMTIIAQDEEEEE